jgi:hypothetical protein
VLDTVFGLPAHPLLVHATVVLVPLAAVFVALAASWPRARRVLGWFTVATAAVALGLVPLSTESGEHLESHLPASDLIEQHAQLADGLLPWVGAMVVTSAALVFLDRRGPRGVLTSRPLALTVAALALIATAGTVTQVVRIGHSGATAVWSDVPAGSAGKAAEDRAGD